MKKTLTLIAAIAIGQLSMINGYAQGSDFSGIADGQEICTDAGTFTLTATNNTTGTFSGPGVTDNANGTATFDPVTAGAGSHNISYQVDLGFVQIAAGRQHSLGIKSDGTLWAWGLNLYGQLGDGTTTQRTSPVQIGTATNWSQIAAGEYHSLAIQSDGTLWAWGRNDYGQLGDGTTTPRTSPVQIGNATNWSHIAAALAMHSLAIQSDGTLWAWGRNDLGHLGDGTTTHRFSPVQIGTATNWSQITVGRQHSFGIKNDGTLWAWGRNDHGQLGDGTDTHRFSPVQIGTATNWSQIAAGWLHSLAIQSDGTLWAWGYNQYGQLGDGTTIFKNSPVQIGTAINWSHIAAGWLHSLGIQSDGTQWAWGYNQYGQLGDGTAIDRSSPLQIGTVTNWSQIAAGFFHNLGIQSDGTLWALGLNEYGQLGDGTTTNRTSPVLIPATVSSTKTATVLTPPVADAPSNVAACDNYTLPNLNIGNYYTETNGGGTLLNAGDDITSTQVLYVYATNGSCSDENTFEVTINSIPSNTVTLSGNTLTADEAEATYQWLDCDNGNAAINGATNQSYEPGVSGNFAVEITKDGCTSTSDCQSLTFVGLNELTQINFSAYPNPTSGELTIELGDFVYSEVTVLVRNSIGQETMRKNYTSINKLDLIIQGAPGIYFVEIRTGDKRAVLKVIKN
jgi:alpha-tubulin suppressor-like RCC1 family protein